jgi:hypothetical protein
MLLRVLINFYQTTASASFQNCICISNLNHCSNASTLLQDHNFHHSHNVASLYHLAGHGSFKQRSLHLLIYPVTAAILRDMTIGIPILSDLYKTRNSKFQFFISLETAFLTFIIRFSCTCFFNEDLRTYQAMIHRMNKNAQPNFWQ